MVVANNPKKNIIGLSVASVLVAVLIYVGLPKLATLYHNKGVEHYNNDLHEEAITSFKSSLKIKPTAITYYCLGNVYAKTKNNDKAIDEYKKAIKANPQYADAYCAISELYSSRQQHQKALKLLEEAIAIIPPNQKIKKLSKQIYYNYAAYCLNEGLIAFFSGNNQKAYALLNKALKLRPDYAYTHYILGYYNFENNNIDEAESKMRDAIGVDPQYWQAYKLLGDIYFKKLSYDQSVAMYKKALEFNQDDAISENDVGIALMQMERYSEALPHLKKALELDPDNPHIMYNLATTYRDGGMFDEAISGYKVLANVKPDYPDMYNNLAGIYNQQGNEEAALDAYYKEIEYSHQRLLSNPDNINTLNSLARAYNGIKEYGKAKEVIKKAIALAPDYRDAYLTFAKIEENLGNYGEALSELTKAESLSVYSDFITDDVARLKAEETLPVQKIYLKNGGVVEGVIKKETDERIVLKVVIGSSKGTITLLRDDIIEDNSKDNT